MKLMKLILLVIALTLVIASWHPIDAGAQTTAVTQQRFNVFLKIAPQEGSAPVRRGTDLSWNYKVELTVSGTSDEKTRQMPPLSLCTGESKSKSAIFGDDRIAYEVAIDPSGEKASAIVEISRNGIPIFVQRLAVWLPPPPKEPGA